MQTNKEGLEIINSFESCRLAAYLPTLDDKWTIGFGHTEGVKEGDVCTQKEAEDWRQQNLAEAELAVERNVSVALNENEFSALVCLVFNIGRGNFRKSSLLRLLNEGDYNAAAEEFKKWNRQAGKVVKGLTRRRAAEALLFTKRVE